LYGYFKREMLQWVYQVQADWTEAGTGKVTTRQGSGFTLNSQSNPLLITNRHLVDPKYQKPWNANLTSIAISGFSKNWLPLKVTATGDPVAAYFSQNYEEDVAVVDLSKQYVKSEPHVPLNWIQRDIILDDVDFSKLIELGDQVVIPGYPAYFDRGKSKAIARTGTIASDPGDDYQGPGQGAARRVAFEALSTGGNSGSPVFAVARGSPNQAISDLPPSRSAKLIGINAGHFKQPSNGSHEGISYLFRMQVVLDILKKNGLDIL
jgi:V8-like Glu-specific endopeptidase